MDLHLMHLQDNRKMSLIFNAIAGWPATCFFEQNETFITIYQNRNGLH